MMDTSKFDALIKETKEQMDVLRQQMEKMCKEFLEATKEFALAWFQSRVESAVTSNLELAKKCGVKGLRNLKADLQEVIAKLPSIVEKHVNSDKYWPHRGEIPEETWGWSTIIYELRNGVREVLGYVGTILIKYGFADTGKHSDWGVKPGSEHLRYSYGFDWSEKMGTITKSYSGLYGELVEIGGKLKEVEREKAVAEAKDLWDKA